MESMKVHQWKRKKNNNMAPAVQETNDESGSVLYWCLRLWFHHATAWTTGTCNNRHRKASPSLSPPSLHSPILPSSEALPGTSSPGSLSAPDENVPGAIDFVSLLSPRPVLQIDYLMLMTQSDLDSWSYKVYLSCFKFEWSGIWWLNHVIMAGSNTLR